MASNIAIPEDVMLDTPLWRFAGKFWSRSGVLDACLELQAHQWSVTDLLCALWLASEDRPFDGLTDPRILTWRSEVTQRLRQVRKAIPKGNPVTESTRHQVASSELEAEKVELALAYREIESSGSQQTSSHQFKNGTAKSLALRNLQSASPEKTMDTKTGTLLETLADELHNAISGECAPC
ncbi:TIGR02444 family protein [Marinobacter sp. CHS3-4]|uniref:TIGR02444 family protein n=1 Tax=Marinobacter sp. CHS3-4 TaxID=3045174 RepID=UPI0024B61760|nr:TIGR02444 family protein [Marinobacter sp. CHS3-4]MDI9246476.1 TIGR02444 family protein [Marinobacter sp. CHS3-4]